MKRMIAILTILTLAGGTGTPLAGNAIAQTVRVQDEQGSQLPGAEVVDADARYSLVPYEGGFLRLDRQTGQTSFCTVKNNNLACRIAAEERQAYLDAIGDLESRIATLEADARESESIKRQERLSPQGKDDGDAGERAPVDDDDLPMAEKELDQAMNMAERAMRRFFDVIQDMRKELEDSERSR